MVRIACLHTAEINVAVFDTALRRSGLKGVELHHNLHEDLLVAAERDGRLAPEVTSSAVEALRDLSREADAVLLTCPTLGLAAEDAAAGSSSPIMRVDGALAAEAVKGAGRVVVVRAVETTVEPTRFLFEAAARTTGAEVTVRLIPDACAAFKAGDRNRYLDMIASAAARPFEREPHGSLWRRRPWRARATLLPRPASDQQSCGRPDRGSACRRTLGLSALG